MFGDCVHMVGDLTKDCIDGIHLVENKRKGLHKLLQLKLTFCLEQFFSLDKLAYEVQATALQVLKSLVQRYNNTAEILSTSTDMVKGEALSTVPTSVNQVRTVESGTDYELDENEDDDDWDTFQSFHASTNVEVSESKTKNIAEEETCFHGSSSIQEDESNERNTSPFAEEADDQHLSSDHAADTTREDSVDKSKGVEEEPIQEALRSENDKTSDDHLVEMKEESVESSEPERILEHIHQP